MYYILYGKPYNRTCDAQHSVEDEPCLPHFPAWTHTCPDFPLPLQAGEREPVVELNRLLHELYDRAGYDLRIDYRDEPEPPLEGEDVAWADELLRLQGVR